MNDLKCNIAELEKERDFYFNKLRNIELVCQEKEGEANPTLQKIVDILYATDVSVAYYLRCTYRSWLVLFVSHSIIFIGCFNRKVFRSQGKVLMNQKSFEQS